MYSMTPTVHASSKDEGDGIIRLVSNLTMLLYCCDSTTSCVCHCLQASQNGGSWINSGNMQEATGCLPLTTPDTVDHKWDASLRIKQSSLHSRSLMVPINGSLIKCFIPPWASSAVSHKPHFTWWHTPLGAANISLLPTEARPPTDRASSMPAQVLF